MLAANPTYRLAYDELASLQEMSADCRAVGRNLRLPELERAAGAVVSGPPSIYFAAHPRAVSTRAIRDGEADARLA